MPHLFLEYSTNLERPDDLDVLAARLHRLLVERAEIPIGNCKTRWRGVPDFHLGRGAADDAFVHLTVRLLEGRSPEIRRAIGEGALALLREAFAPAAEGRDLQVTVEIAEIARDGYFKHPDGTL